MWVIKVSSIHFRWKWALSSDGALCLWSPAKVKWLSPNPTRSVRDSSCEQAAMSDRQPVKCNPACSHFRCVWSYSAGHQLSDIPVLCESPNRLASESATPKADLICAVKKKSIVPKVTERIKLFLRSINDRILLISKVRQYFNCRYGYHRMIIIGNPITVFVGFSIDLWPISNWNFQLSSIFKASRLDRRIR